MPIYCEILQLVLPKEIIKSKYKGGLEQFKQDYHWGKVIDHEDAELISVASMENSFATPQGLHYNEESKSSLDFVIVARYGTPALSWEVDWCKSNKVFIWHKDCKLSSYKKMMEVCALTVNQIEQIRIDTGESPLKDIF